MFRAEEFQLSPENVAWQPPNLNYDVPLMKPKPLPLQENMNRRLPMGPAHGSLPGLIDPCFLRSQTEQEYEAYRRFHCFPSHFQTVPPKPREYFPDTLSRLSHKNARKVSTNADSGTLQKKFLIFDHSGNTTRLIYGPGFPFFQNQPTTTGCLFHNEKGYQNHATKYNLLDQCDHNHLNEEESEMREDTEEINALLYSDDDCDDCSEDDEVPSTCHFPLATEETLNQEAFKDTNEEVASTNGPNKRQKFLDGWCKGASLLDPSCLMKLDEPQGCVSDAESRYSVGGKENPTAGITEDEIDSKEVNVQLKKDKIRETIKVLENIIPGAKGKEPILVIDDTIVYLKSLMSSTNTFL